MSLPRTPGNMGRFRRTRVASIFAGGPTPTPSEGPMVSAPQHRGFGTVVMEAMAERTLPHQA